MRILLIFIALLVHSTSFAGIFGPSSFEECVLEKMKGQQQSMLRWAQDACLKKFPPEPVENFISIDNGDWTWSQQGGTITVSVIRRPKGTKLVRAEAIFYEKCEGQQTYPGVQATAEKSMFSDTFEFAVNKNRNFGCARVNFIGIAP